MVFVNYIYLNITDPWLSLSGRTVEKRMQLHVGWHAPSISVRDALPVRRGLVDAKLLLVDSRRVQRPARNWPRGRGERVSCSRGTEETWWHVLAGGVRTGKLSRRTSG